MKTRVLLLLVCLLGISGIKLSANPKPHPPEMLINELFFDENGDWTIELNSYSYYSEDELEIFSTTGKAKIIGTLEVTEDGFWVITQANLDKPLSINIEGDSISIVSGYEFLYGELCFGNHPSASIGSPKEGQSIVLNEVFEDFGAYSLCNNPTIGEYNDREDVYATIKGKLYSEDGNILANKRFDLNTDFIDHYFMRWPLTLSKESFETNDEGEFSVDVFAANYTKDLYLYSWNPGSSQYYHGDIKEIDLNLYPKDTVVCDFHLVKSYHGSHSLEEAQSNESLIKIFPNPVGKNKALNYEIDLPVNALNIVAEIYSLSGSLLLSQKIEENAGTINVSSLAKGNYILKFSGEKGDQYSTKILIE